MADEQTRKQIGKRMKSWKDPTAPANPRATGLNRVSRMQKVTSKKIGLTDHIHSRYK